MGKKRIFFLLLAGAVFLLLPKDTLASAFTIQTNKQSLINDEEIIIAVSIDGLPANTKYFLQAAFTKVDQSTNYLGYTQNNNGQWYCYVSSPTEKSLADSFYSLITNNDGDWLGILMAKADLVDSGFKGTGDYYLQVKRFTEGGSGTWSDNKITVNISQDLLFTPMPTATILPSPPHLTSGLTPTVMATAVPTATQPTPTSALTPAPAKAIYQINEVKNEKGEVLSSVKIYVDDQYIHHYAPEVLEFGDDYYCDDDKKVACGFGEHVIRLEKNGYQDWEETKEIKAGDAYLVNPVMAFLPSPTPTPTATPFSSLSPTGRISPSPSLAITSLLLSPTFPSPLLPFADFALAPKKITSEEKEILEESSGQVLGEEKKEKKNSGWYFGVGAFYLGAFGWRLARRNDNDIMEKLNFEEK